MTAAGKMERENTPQFRSIKTHDCGRTLNLPDEIIEQILSRLSVKSLLKFRCVSKSWRSLIGSERFIKTHLENSMKSTSLAKHGIILNPIQSYRKLKQCSLSSLLNEPSTDPFRFVDSINIRWESICLVGCCNGLVCILLDRKYFVLWNPSTRMSKRLPEIDDKIKHGHITKYGFGCDESSGDHKVFAIMSVFWTIGRPQVIGKIYSLKTNSWKITKNKDISPFDAGAKFASGKLHWWTISISDWDIVSFDLKSEVYGTVEQPSFSKGVFDTSLGVLGECICMLYDYHAVGHLDLWVMKHYGVKESWDKIVTVTHLHDLPRVHYFNPFCIGPNGEIILIYGSSFKIYYPKDKAFKHPLITFREADLYVESLVSLIPDDELER